MSSYEHNKFLFEKLKNSGFFSNLSDSTLKELFSYCEEITLEKNEILFRQNDPSTAMYIVISGYLLALLTDHFDHLHTIGGIKNGELIGEMGLLSNKPRSLTIKALVKTKLLKLSQESFYAFIKKVNDHELFIQIIKSIIQRQQTTLTFLANKEIKNHILILKMNDEKDITPFIDKLNSIITKSRKIFFCDINKLNHLYNDKDEEYANLINYIDDIEKDHQTIFYYFSGSLMNIPSLILHRINFILSVAHGGTRPYVTDEYLKFVDDKFMIKHCLVLLWPSGKKIEGTKRWLELSKYHHHYHIFINDQNDYERLLRIFTKQGIGLVFSGGGARVWFHMGVLKAIMDKNIPIDAVCGTSSGSGVAACFLTTQNFEELYRIIQKISLAVKKGVSWYSMTWPVVSFYNGLEVTHYLQEFFGNQTIEDLKLPYLAVSTNVNTGLEYLFTQGPLWEAVRASSAIPGIFPPLIKDGALLLDGGMTNNLPVDHMIKMLHGKGITLVSDNSTFVPDKTQYKFPPTLSLANLLLHKVRIQKKDYLFPSFADMILKAMLSGSGDKYRKNIQLSTHYIRSDLSMFRMFLFDPALQRKLLMLGYLQASVELEHLQKNNELLYDEKSIGSE